MSQKSEPLHDETNVSEITIQPDGRVYVFGASRDVIEVLELLNPSDTKLGRLMKHVRRLMPGRRDAASTRVAKPVDNANA